MGWTRIGFARLPAVVDVAAPLDKPNISHIEYATSALPSTTTDQQARRARIRGIREPDETCLRLAAPAGEVPAVAPEEALPEYSADEVAAHDGKEGRGICEYAQIPLSITKSCPDANRLHCLRRDRGGRQDLRLHQLCRHAPRRGIHDLAICWQIVYLAGEDMEGILNVLETLTPPYGVSSFGNSTIENTLLRGRQRC